MQGLDNVRGAELKLNISFSEGAGYLMPTSLVGPNTVKASYSGQPAYAYIDMLLTLESRQYALSLALCVLFYLPCFFLFSFLFVSGFVF